MLGIGTPYFAQGQMGLGPLNVIYTRTIPLCPYALAHVQIRPSVFSLDIRHVHSTKIPAAALRIINAALPVVYPEVDMVINGVLNMPFV